jgi:membrane fusion protein, heavy metal efflux system
MRYFIVIILIGLISCGSNDTKHDVHKETEENHNADSSNVSITEAQYKSAGITIGKPEKKQISGTFRANGVLDVPPQQQVSISIPLGGFLKRTELLEGMRVKKGQLLATIENPEYIQMQQDYLEAKSQLEYARSDYERQQQLSKENINAKKTLQQASSSYQSLTARVNGLREKIKSSGINLSAVEKGNIQSFINIYSPIAGFVTKVNANIGKFVNPVDVLFEIVDTEHLHVELTVFEKDVPKLQIGQKLRFTLANENTERTAKIYLIGREIEENRTVRVHCHIDKEDIHLLPGMYLKAVIESGQNEVNSLPEEAVVDYLGNKYVFVQQDSLKYMMTPVITGNSDNGFIEVDAPFEKNIVIKGAYDLLAKMKNSGEGHDH